MHQAIKGLCLVGILVVKPVYALEIIFNDIGGAEPGSLAWEGFDEAASLWESHFDDPIEVYVDIGFRDLGPGILGQARSFDIGTSYQNVRDSLINDITTDTDVTVAANLPISDTLTFLTNGPDGVPFIDDNGTRNNAVLAVNRANLKALDLLDSTARDGEIQFSTNFSYDFDPSDGVDPGLFDFVGIAAHEIGHVLGYVSGVDYVDFFSGDGPATGLLSSFENRDIYSVLDLFRFSDRSLAEGETLRDLAVGDVDPFFSIDGGETRLAQLSSGSYNGNGRQASHWDDTGFIGLMQPTISSGQVGRLTQTDLLAFDAIGFNLVESPIAVDAPHSLGLHGLGLLMLGWVLQRTRKRKHQVHERHHRALPKI